MKERRATRILEIAVAVTVAAVLLSEVLLYAPPGPGGVSVSMTLDGNGNSTVIVNYSVASSVSSHFNAGVYLRNATFPFTTIYYYFDKVYPTAQVTLQWWDGLSLHLAAVAASRDFPLTIIYLNASQLAAFLVAPPLPGTALIVASGDLPHTVFNNQTRPLTNLVTPWIEAGGDLIWFGGRIGYWSGYPNEPLSTNTDSYVGPDGTEQFVNPSIFGGSGTWAYNNRSSDASWFNFADSSTYPLGGLKLTGVLSSSGTVIGNMANSYTNAAIFPLGAGRLAYFSIPLATDVTLLSISLTNMLQAGFFEAGTTLLATTLVFTYGTSTITGSWPVSVPPPRVYPYPGATSDVCYSLFQTDYLAPFGFVRCVQASAILS